MISNHHQFELKFVYVIKNIMNTKAIYILDL